MPRRQRHAHQPAHAVPDQDDPAVRHRLLDQLGQVIAELLDRRRGLVGRAGLAVPALVVGQHLDRLLGGVRKRLDDLVPDPAVLGVAVHQDDGQLGVLIAGPSEAQRRPVVQHQLR